MMFDPFDASRGHRRVADEDALDEAQQDRADDRDEQHTEARER